MTTDKELADAYRLVLNDRDQPIGMPHEEYKARIQQLDPPKPEWPDGTIAWVRFGGVAPKVLAYMADGRWCDNLTYTKPDQRDKVEPLRVLGDDEIALPRAAFDLSFGPRDSIRARQYAETAELQRFLSAARVFRAYADALDAEAGDQ